MLQVSVYRYDPAKDAAPYMKDYELDTGGKDMMVLDVLELLKAKDQSLTYRRSCREGRAARGERATRFSQTPLILIIASFFQAPLFLI